MNDEYCDCPGGGDEPGTSACPGGHFYCRNAPHTPLNIPSSLVNDGVCDCCDGSDEWRGVATCRNTCEAGAAEHHKVERAQAEGRVLGRQYAAEGRAARTALGGGEVPWGPHNAFHHLNDKCFSVVATEYTYEVCWFKSVTQKSASHQTHSLGNTWTWGDGSSSGTFSGGAKCFNGPARSTKVRFVCGHPEDKIVRIQEDEKCVYGLTFVTAAAC